MKYYFSTKVIENDGLYKLNSDLNEVFLANSSEAILQFFPLNAGLNTFESGDQRLIDWVGSIDDGTQTFYFPFKYKVQHDFVTLLKTEYAMVLRLAEQYLIRAEARAQEGNIVGAQADLNAIRNRASLANTTSSDKASLLLAIEQERKAGLFTEWGIVG